MGKFLSKVVKVAKQAVPMLVELFFKYKAAKQDKAS